MTPLLHLDNARALLFIIELNSREHGKHSIVNQKYLFPIKTFFRFNAEKRCRFHSNNSNLRDVEGKTRRRYQLQLVNFACHSQLR